MPEEMALRVGELARRTGLSVRTLHHYDDLGLLTPSGRSSGDHRLYSVADLQRLLAIVHLRELGLSLAEVRAALDEPGFDPAATLDAHIDAVQERLATQRALLARLRALRAQGQGNWEAIVHAITLTQQLRHPEPYARIRAALGAPPAPVRDLVEQLTDDPEPGVREVVTWALSRHGSSAVEPLLKRLDDPDPVVRGDVARALGKVGDPLAVPALVARLGDPEAAVRSAAVRALGSIGRLEAAAPLAALLADPDPLVRANSVDSLVALGPDAVAAVIGALRDAGPGAREAAAEVLGALGTDPAVTALVRLLDDADPGVRLAAVAGLDGRPAAAGALVRAAADPDPRVSALARRLAEPPAVPAR